MSAWGFRDGRVCSLGVPLTVAPLDVPVGFDGYSYGLRDVTGQKVHLSRPQGFMDRFGTGDVIGMHISLPRILKREEGDTPVFRDRIPIRFKGQLYFEQPDYIPSKEMEEYVNPVIPPQSQPPAKPVLATLPTSSIKVYKNGIFQGVAFSNLLSFLPPSSQLSGGDLDDGMLGYYPCASVFRRGIVKMNFGPEFEFPAPEGVRPASERWEEMRTEEAEWDLREEREWEGERVRDTGLQGVGGSEIKELADDWT
jgi:COMPASS component BRE2